MSENGQDSKRLTRPITILYADDDPDDRLLTKNALKKSRLANELRLVEDGEELMDYLLRRGAFSDPKASPRPDLILLDLRMPRKDGLQALKELKATEGLRAIPVIVLTTSKAEEDVVASYDLGAASYIKKPVTFQSLVDIVAALDRYWFELVILPSPPSPVKTSPGQQP